MPITVNNVQSTTSINPAANLPIASYAVTAGSNSKLVGFGGMERGVDRTLSAAFNVTALSELLTLADDDTTEFWRVSAFFNDAVAGTQDLDLNASGDWDRAGWIGCTLLDVAIGGAIATATGTGTSASPSTNITAVSADSILVDCILANGDGITLTKDASQTLIAELEDIDNNISFGASFKLNASTGSKAMAWTLGSSVRFVHIVMELNGIAAAGAKAAVLL